MEIRTDIFEKREEFNKFLWNSLLQYIKLKFGNKKNLISSIQNNFGIKIPKNANYVKISEILKENSIDFYKDVLGVSLFEIVHLYSFYRLLIDIFWETTWIKTFSPFYTFLFNEEIKIRKKSELRKYAAKIITEFEQQELEEKWLEYSISHAPITLYGYFTPVIHYEHLTIGPVGFNLSIYYREKEMSGNYTPIMAILATTTYTDTDIFDWERTDAFKLFSSILKELNKKINEVAHSYPIYNEYLNWVGFEFPYSEWEKELLNFAKLFKTQIMENKIPVDFYKLVQLSTMFFKDEEIIDMFNKLIAENVLFVKSETEIGDIKITRDGMIKRPKSWFAKPAFDLAMDIASIESKSPEEIRELLIEILKNGTIQYLEKMFDNNFEMFRLICARRGLHKFASVDKFLIPKERAIRLILESYGLRAPSTLGLDIREEIYSFLEEIERFEREYRSLEERELIRRIIGNLRNGRTHFERILKEWLFIMVSLTLHYEESLSEGLFENIFILDRPVFHIWYNVEQRLEEIKRKFREFFERLASSEELKISRELRNKIDKYAKRRKIDFTVGDWLSLLQCSIRYVDRNLSPGFWSNLPENLYEDINDSIAEIERYSIGENALKWLNLASHEGAMREFRENIKSREDALNTLLKLRRVILSILQKLPELIVIKEKVTEVKTGWEYYEVECATDKSVLKIYGTRFIEPQFLYYLIPAFEEKEDILTYPILITDLTDNVF